MLQAAVIALFTHAISAHCRLLLIWLANNGIVSYTAPADFQAGLIWGFNGTDVHALLRECWILDQKMADTCDSFFESIEKKDWSTVEATIKQCVPTELEVDIEPCKDNEKYKPVMDQYYLHQHTIAAAKNDPDW